MFGAISLTFLAIITLIFFAEKFANQIPYKYEKQIADNFYLTAINDSDGNKPLSAPIELYLQNLANKLALAQQLPEGMNITVHYIADDTINAFATLGGHIVFFRGLLQKLPDENALAMVMAHEIAHIKHRHPISGMSRAIIISIAIAAVSGSTDNSTLGNMLGNTSLLTALSFTRDQERDADNTALDALANLYGHTQGSKSLFEIFQTHEKENNITTPEFFSSHPVTKDRINNIDTLSNKQNWKTTGALTNLPDEFQDWLKINEDK